MRFNIFSKSWDEAQRSNSLLLFIVAGLTAIALVQELRLWQTHDVVALTPPGLEKVAKVGIDSASREYLESWGLYFVASIGNLTPRNAKFVADRMTSYVDPSIYPTVRKTLLSYADDPVWQQSAGSIRFDAIQVIFEPETGKVFVVGDYTVRTAASNAQTTPMTYELKIVIRDYRPVVMSVDSYPGAQPHTVKWLGENPQPEKEKEK